MHLDFLAVQKMSQIEHHEKSVNKGWREILEIKHNETFLQKTVVEMKR